MKKTLLFLFLLVSLVSVKAQHTVEIDSLRLEQAGPGNAYSLILIADWHVIGGPALVASSTMQWTGNTASVVKCHDTAVPSLQSTFQDTILLGQLSAGNYEVIFTGKIGHLSSADSCAMISSHYYIDSGTISFTIPFLPMVLKSPKSVNIKRAELVPNPAKGLTLLQAANGEQLLGMITVHDLAGRLIWQELATASAQKIALDKFTPGLYLVHYQTMTGAGVCRLLVE